MKFICDKREFVSGLNIAMRAVPAKSSMPILECIRIGACDGVVALMSNDMEFCIHTTLTAMVMENGSVCLDAKLLNEIIRKLPDGDVTLETDEKCTAKISCEKSRFQILGKDSDEFPPVPDVKGGLHFEIDQIALRDMIQKTIFCVAQDYKNKMMTGICLDVEGDKLTAVALDGFRVGVKQKHLDGSYEKTKAVVPGRALSEVSKILTSGTSDICIDKNHMVFYMDGTSIFVRLYEPDYFDYKKFLTADCPIRIIMNRDELLDCVNRCSVLIRDGSKKPVVFDFHDNTVTISASTTLGTVSEELEISKEGQNLKIGFNPRMMMDAIAATDEDEVEIRMASPKAPAFVTKNDRDYLYVVLPVNLG